jgi:hypothetical protein
MIVNAVTDVLSVTELEALMATPEMTSWRARHGIALGGSSRRAETAAAPEDGETDLFDVDTLMQAAQ